MMLRFMQDHFSIFFVDVGKGKQYYIGGNANGEIVLNYDYIYPGIFDKWFKQKQMDYLSRYFDVKYLVDKEKLELLIKPYKDEILKKKVTGGLSL